VLAEKRRFLESDDWEGVLVWPEKSAVSAMVLFGLDE